jgi:dTDP-4-amino-4,6-dideoxygalactose transaminase
MRAIYVTKPTRVSVLRFVFYVSRIFGSGIFTNYGQTVRTLEAKLRTEFGLENVVVMNNGTTPIMFLMSELSPGSRVLTTPFSFVATSSAIAAMGMVPVFADIDPETGGIDTERVREALQREKIHAMLFTHVYGSPCDVTALHELAREYDIPLYFDAAHAVGVDIDGTSVLNFGDASTISFHATKLMSCGEGGALVTKSEELAERARRWINFGIAEGEILSLGVNGKMSELQAAMGLSTLPNVAREIRRRTKLMSRYQSALSGVNLRFLPSPNHGYIPVILPSAEQVGLIVDALGAQGIFPRRYFYPSLDSLEFLGSNASSLPASRDLAGRVLCLPSGRDVTRGAVASITACIRKTLGE